MFSIGRVHDKTTATATRVSSALRVATGANNPVSKKQQQDGRLQSTSLKLNRQLNQLQQDLKRSFGKFVTLAAKRTHSNLKRGHGVADVLDSRRGSIRARHGSLKCTTRRLVASGKPVDEHNSLRRTMSDVRRCRHIDGHTKNQRQHQQQICVEKHCSAQDKRSTGAKSIWDSLRATTLAERHVQGRTANVGNAGAGQRQRRLIGNFELIQQKKHNKLFTLAVVLGLLALCADLSTTAPISGIIKPIWFNGDLIANKSPQQLSLDEGDAIAAELNDQAKMANLAVKAKGADGDDDDDANQDDESEFREPTRGSGTVQQQKPDEQLWIERRRLERDRALEPPAWLRDRPIRNDPAASGQGQEQEESPRVGAPRSRLSSRETYEQLLRRLIEEVPQDRSFLANFYDELNASLQRMDSRGPSATTESAEGEQMAQQPIRTSAENAASSDSSILEGQIVGQDKSGSLAASAGYDAILEAAEQLAADELRMFYADHGASQQNQPQQQQSDADNASGAQPAMIDEADTVGAQRSPYVWTPETVRSIRSDELQRQHQQQQQILANEEQLIDFGEHRAGEWHNNADWMPAAVSKRATDKQTDESDRLEMDNEVERGERSQSRLDDLLSEADQQEQQPSTGTQDHDKLLTLAIRLIRSGLFTRNQLIHYANKLKNYFEDHIGLTRGSISSLFPIDDQQLLVGLDTSKLSASDRTNLQSLDALLRGQSWLVLVWNQKDAQGGSKSPIPILQAILSALYDDELDERRARIARQLEAQLQLDLQQRAPAALERDAAADNVPPSATNWLRPVASDLAPLRAAFGRPDWPQENSAAHQWSTAAVLMPSDQKQPLDWPLASAAGSDGAQDGRSYVPLAAAAAYLSALYSSSSTDPAAAQLAVLFAQRRASDSQAANLQQASVAQSAIGLILARLNNLLERLADQAYLVNVLALLLALCITFVLLRCALRRHLRDAARWTRRRLSTDQSRQAGTGALKGLLSADDRSGSSRFGGSWEWPRAGSIRSLWRTPDDAKDCKQTDGQLAGSPAAQKDLEAAPLCQRRDSTDSGLDATLNSFCASEKSKASGARQQIDLLLTKHLLGFLSDRAGSRSADSKANAAKAQVAPEKDKAEEPAHFRSSTSYIRSLIDALTKATARSSQAEAIDKQVARNLANSRANSDDAELQVQSGAPRFHQDEAQEIIMSQMDISAAHLILDYMEKHLEDKERLRREWLELNAATSSSQQQQQQQQPHQALAPIKARHLVLQRLAKVALSADNLAKNRNPQVVPFDRNRVRLGSGKRNPFQQQQQQQQPSKQTKRSQQSDYINASFIYDDDSRRPTHIIAQGPSEQTSGQFWQMIWEQEVSVIVMLTRLNENGKQMCHCYWPNAAAGANGESQASARASEPIQNRSPPAADDQLPQQSPNGQRQRQQQQRRGSVTSVFSMTSASTPTQSAPIVANGELTDNALCFEIALACGEQSSLRLEVHLVSEHVSSNDYLVRNMYLINKSTGESRTLTQFHYLAWPDSRTPDNVRSLLQFRRKVQKSFRTPDSPILVHCSDGAGRSGTYTLIDLILERIKNGAKEIDLRATLEHLRDQRVGLCATQSQFEFVLVALAEEIQIILNALPQ